MTSRLEGWIEDGIRTAQTVWLETSRDEAARDKASQYQQYERKSNNVPESSQPQTNDYREPRQGKRVKPKQGDPARRAVTLGSYQANQIPHQSPIGDRLGVFQTCHMRVQSHALLY